MPGLRRGFALEVFVALLHAPPTGLPPTHLPRPGECRLAGYAPENANPKSLERCVAVYASVFGMLVFLRLYLLLRVLRDTATVWRYRSSVEAASTKRFVYFPPVGMRAATMWHVHQRPLTLLVWFQASDPLGHWGIRALEHGCIGALGTVLVLHCYRIWHGIGYRRWARPWCSPSSCT